jgi:hypothetical protein
MHLRPLTTVGTPGAAGLTEACDLSHLGACDASHKRAENVEWTDGVNGAAVKVV